MYMYLQTSPFYELPKLLHIPIAMSMYICQIDELIIILNTQ